MELGERLENALRWTLVPTIAVWRRSESTVPHKRRCRASRRVTDPYATKRLSSPTTTMSKNLLLAYGYD
jgi:hypothetical protein